MQYFKVERKTADARKILRFSPRNPPIFDHNRCVVGHALGCVEPENHRKVYGLLR
jgi:hypothetical protein